MSQQQGMQDALMAAMSGQTPIFGPNGLNLNLDTSSLFLVLNVRRDHLVEDTLQVLQDADPSKLKQQLKVIFRGEDGQDAGGVSREFFRLLGEQLFTTDS